MNQKLSGNIFALIIFMACLCIGHQLSLRKPLWGDEIYTQVYSIEHSSWTTILKGKIPEGCNTPLYYLLQKAVLSAAHYHLPFSWSSPEDGKIADERAQALLRLSANGAMSLAIALIARYFFLMFSSLGACLALLSCFSSYMVLDYGAEARPYALWFLLTTIQILLLMEFSSAKPDKNLKGLSAIHCLLGMTVIISAGQILIGALWLWLNGIKKIRQHFVLTVLPLCFCFYYFHLASGQGTLYHYKMTHPLKLIHEAFGLDRLLLLLVLGLIYLIFCRVNKPSTQLMPPSQRWFLIFSSIGYLLSALALMGYYKMNEIPGQTAGALNSRYLIFLAPVEIISITYLTITVFRFLWKNRAGFWIGQFIILVSFFYMIRILLLYQEIYGTALFAY